jgi:glyoxylase-like metal-dependent hydrolase (beta-lactamase superfamily II)
MKSWKTNGGYRIVRLLADRSNVYLLTNDEVNVLIDTSTRGNWRRLDARLKSLKISRLDLLILTHSHYDHADNARKLRDRYGAPVIAHRAETRYLESGGMPVPGGTNFVTRFIVRTLGRFLAVRNVEACPCDVLVDSKHDLSPLGLNAYILPTPGHSPGSISVIVDDEIAVVGDAMFGVFGWSVLPPYVADLNQTVESWGLLLTTGCRIFLPSHGSARSRDLLQAEYVRHRKN